MSPKERHLRWWRLLCVLSVLAVLLAVTIAFVKPELIAPATPDGAPLEGPDAAGPSEGWGEALLALIIGVVATTLLSLWTLTPLRRAASRASGRAADDAQKRSRSKGNEEARPPQLSREETKRLQEALSDISTLLSSDLPRPESLQPAAMERKFWESQSRYEEAQRELQQRRAQDAALAAEKALLEKRMQERTAELKAANRELARAARAKDEFLASMSHELRTPLHAILGLSEALREEIYGPLNEQQQRFLGDMEESGRHLLALINDILDIARLGTDSLPLEPDSINVPEVCRSAVSTVRRDAISKGLELELKIDRHVEILRADRRRLEQILVNLLSNAVKFTPNGKRLGLTVEGDAEAKAIHFIVWDSGIGIAPERLPKLFRPFVQLDGRLARHYGGTGLGLALVFQLARLHGGRVQVETNPGEGSRFSVTIPWARGTAPKDGSRRLEIGPVPPIQRFPHSPLILLAEGSPANVGPLKDCLERAGARVIVADTGRQTLELALETRPDLIVMAMQLPLLDGLEVTRWMRDDPRLRHLPVVAVTALSVEGDRERCLAAGVDDYLLQPVQPEELLTAVEAQLCRERVRQKRLFPEEEPEVTGLAAHVAVASEEADPASRSPESVGQTPTRSRVGF